MDKLLLASSRPVSRRILSGSISRSLQLLAMAASGVALASAASTSENLILNGRFFGGPGVSGFAWVGNPDSANRGAVDVVAGLDGNRLRMRPNVSNVPASPKGFSYGVMQGVAAKPLLGRRLYFSGRIEGVGEAAAVLRLYTVREDGSRTFQEVRRSAAGNGPVQAKDMVVLPNDDRVLFLILSCEVEGIAGEALFENVELLGDVPSNWLEAKGTPDPGGALESAIVVDALPKRTIPQGIYGINLEWVWDGLGVWSPAIGAVNPQVLNLAGNAGFTTYRFPGGIFADFYHWQQGVGPQSSRGTAEIYPGGPQGVHRFGTDEALAFAGAAGGQMIMTVNIVTGTPEEAAEWVRYVNRTSRRVQYWELGNESYHNGGSLAERTAAMTPEEYSARFLRFARAMRAVDPGIKLGAICDEQLSHTITAGYLNWTDKVLTVAAGEIDFLSLHLGYAPVIWDDKGWDARTVYAAQLASPALIAARLAELNGRIAKIAPGRASQIELAVTEWGPLFQLTPAGRFVDHPKTLASGLYTASVLKAFIETPGVGMANFFKLIDNSFLGSIGYRQGQPTANPSLMAIQMYRRMFGTQLVDTQTHAPTYSAPSIGWADAVSEIPYLDTVSSLSADGKKLYVLAINKNFDRAIHSRISIRDFVPSATATIHTLNGTAADANTGTELPQFPGITWTRQATIEPNSRFYNGGPGEVTLNSVAFNGAAADFQYTFPPHSVTSIELRAVSQ